MRRREIRILFLLAAALTITGCMGQQETGHRIRSFLYLYPRNALEVSVQPEVQEQISCAYPSCEEEWRVIARPDGTIAGLDDGQEYSCLFRESVLEGLPKEPLSGELQAGYVVKGEDTAAFLQEIFSKMGLFPSEYHELLISFRKWRGSPGTSLQSTGEREACRTGFRLRPGRIRCYRCLWHTSLWKRARMRRQRRRSWSPCMRSARGLQRWN